MVGAPIFVGVAGEVGIEVARIAGDFSHGGAWTGSDWRCHLSDDEPFVVAVEDIDIYPAIRASCNRIIPPGTLTG